MAFATASYRIRYESSDQGPPLAGSVDTTGWPPARPSLAARLIPPNAPPCVLIPRGALLHVRLRSAILWRSGGASANRAGRERLHKQGRGEE